MKIRTETLIQSESVGNFQTVQSKISDRNLGMALDAVSKNLYSNPIGSFVREVVSNGVDANRRNEQTELVKVEIYEDLYDDVWYFQVTDRGKGMSIDTFTNVYMSWFESDKRDSDEQIGGWGVGSKSPLAYTNNYEVITINEGIKYHWVIVRESPAPTATLLSQKPTTEPSGTIVKVEIEENDLYKVHEECVRQLAYFNNVVVVNQKYLYDNEFKIVETEHYRVRTGERPFSTMHICLGQVPYPINWDFLGMEPIKMPVALTFDINELPVTLSREEINYNKKSSNIKEILMKKIHIAFADLRKRYADQMKTDNFRDFFRYVDSPKSTLELGEVSLEFDIGKRRKPMPQITIEGLDYSMKKEELETLFSLWRAYFLNKRGELVPHEDKVQYYHFAWSNPVLKKGEVSHWKNLYYDRHNNGVKIIQEKVGSFKLRTRIVANVLGKSYKKATKSGIKNKLEVGSAVYAYKFLKALKAWVELRSRSYDDVPESFIKEEKEKQRLLKEERKGIITYYDAENKSNQISFEDLYKYDYVFYANREWDERTLTAYHLLFEELPKWAKNKYIFIKVSVSVYRKLKPKKDKFYTVKNIWNVKALKNHFINIKYVYQKQSIQLKQLYDVSKYYAKLYSEITKYSSNIDHTYSFWKYEDQLDGTKKRRSERIYVNLYEIFKTHIDAMHSTSFYKSDIALKELSKVELPLMKICNLSFPTDGDMPYIKDIIKKYKLTKLNSKYYGK